MASTDQYPQPDLRIYGSIKGKGEKGGVVGGQMTVAARRACWLVGWQQRFMAADTLESISVCQCLWKQRRIWRWSEAASQSDIISYLQLFCLEGRQCMFIFARRLSNVWGCERTQCGNYELLQCLLCIKGCCLTICTLLGFHIFLGQGGGTVSKHTVSISALCSSWRTYLHPTSLFFFPYNLSWVCPHLNFPYLSFFVSACLLLSPITPTHGGVWLWVHWSSITHLCKCSSSIIHGARSWQVTVLSWGWAANSVHYSMRQVEGTLTGWFNKVQRPAAWSHWSMRSNSWLRIKAAVN